MRLSARSLNTGAAPRNNGVAGTLEKTNATWPDGTRVLSFIQRIWCAKRRRHRIRRTDDASFNAFLHVGFRLFFCKQALQHLPFNIAGIIPQQPAKLRDVLIADEFFHAPLPERNIFYVDGTSWLRLEVSCTHAEVII